MLKSIKFDLYKILKTKSILIITGISLFIELSVFILHFVINNYGHATGVIELLADQVNNLDVLVILFTILFVCKDFSSGYIKNFYNEVGKLEYVLSKFIVVSLYVILYQFIFFLMSLFFVYAFGERCFFYYMPYHTEADMWEAVRQAISVTISLVVVGFVTTFFCFLFKKEYIVLVVILPWMLFLQSIVIGIIRDILSVWPSLASFDMFELRVLARNDYKTLITKIMAIVSATSSFLWSYLLYRNKKI